MKAQDHIGAHVNGLKSSIHALEVQITILKQLCGMKGKASEETEAEESETETEESEDDDFGAKKSAKGKAGKKAAKGFDDSEESEEEEAEESEEEEAEESEEEEEEEEEKPAKGKAGKAKKLTADDVNDACKELAGRTNRATAMAVLKKFKVKSVSDLDPSDYEAVIKALKKGK
jgi:TATA-binding protein-associated factor Taf7